jgi:hypothetical protein
VRLSIREPAGELALAEVPVLRASVRKVDHEVTAACARDRLGSELGSLARRKVSQHAPGLVPNTEPIIGQFIEPLLYGRSTGLSLISVVISAIFWGWLWGPSG